MPSESSESSATEFVMFYNVENLFLPSYNPAKRTATKKSGLYKWNSIRYQHKLKNLAKVFGWTERDFGKLPCIIGLAEVQGKRALRDMLDQEILADYHFIHFDSLDERGVDVAMLYHKEKVEILHAEPVSCFFKIPVQDPNAYDTTRDILYCIVKIRGCICHLFVVHLPSKQERDVNKPKRDFILEDLHDKISEILTENQEPVIIMGDFNENPTQESLKKLTFNKNSEPVLTNFYEKMYLDEKFTTFYGKNGMVFDQILASNQFLKNDAALQLVKAEIFNRKELGTSDSEAKNRPFRTYVGSRYLGGFSDHFPVLLEIQIKQENK